VPSFYFLFWPGAIVLLALGDFLWACASVARGGLLLFSSGSFTESVCIALRQLNQFGSWSSLAWSLAILVLLLDSDPATDEARRPKMWFGLFGAVAYGVPSVLLLLQLSIGMDVVWNQPLDGPCFLQAPFHFYLWYLPVIFLAACNLILFVCVLIRFRNSLHLFSLSFRMCLFPLVMIVTWGLNIFTSLLVVSSFPLLAVQAFLITAQGVCFVLLFSVCFVFFVFYRFLQERGTV
jgi:hypothetical protein